ncbi:hypothetical protein C0989_000718 [Termitomyces sp. Mn162]|nr:hypothetical protein C0989_000718 [Termitomyces sp. Mn162]
MLSQVEISVSAALTTDVMEVDDNGPELIMALMQLLALPWWSYPLLPTRTRLSDTPSTSSSALEQPTVALTSKEKGKATATLPPTLEQKMIKQCFPAKKKGKGKAKEPEPLTAMDEQIAHLLQWLHEARVPEDVGADILDNPVVQLALAQVLNELNVVQNQRDEAHVDLF